VPEGDQGCSFSENGDGEPVQIVGEDRHLIERSGRVWIRANGYPSCQGGVHNPAHEQHGHEDDPPSEGDSRQSSGSPLRLVQMATYRTEELDEDDHRQPIQVCLGEERASKVQMGWFTYGTSPSGS